MIYLFCREIITFYNGEIKKDTVVIQDANPSEMIDLDLNMEFSHLPCNLVSLDQEDSLGNHDFDISDTIKKYRRTKSAKNFFISSLLKINYLK